ncbi:hypothetical protein [Streptomyces coeruleorubidus]|uniref:hypothetical protein n=1 Tax=Streptomyces coeruleorubidus TaxID=116188 RepID=UPI003795BA89
MRFSSGPPGDGGSRRPRARSGWTSASALLPLAGGVLLGAGFMAWEVRCREAAVFDVRLLRVPSFTGAIVLSSSAGSSPSGSRGT